MQVQQGDVLFCKVESIPPSAKAKKTPREGLVTFAEGEVTGHHHSCVADAGALFEVDGILYFSAEQETVVKHQEHAPITLPPGKYRVGVVREVDPFADEIRSVRD